MNHKALERRIKRHIMAPEHKVFFALQPGLEEGGIRELGARGVEARREEEGGSLTASMNLENLWRLVLGGHSFSRIYLRLSEFRAQGFRELKRKLGGISLGALSSGKLRVQTTYYHPPFPAPCSR